MIIIKDFNKQELFDKYINDLKNLHNFLINNNIPIIGTFQENMFLCPICFEFQSFELTSCEDVPQESLGGNYLTLTCKKCNNDLGGLVDVHLINKINYLNLEKYIPNSSHTLKAKDIITGTNYFFDATINNLRKIEINNERGGNEKFNNDLLQYIYKNLSNRTLSYEDFKKEFNKLSKEYLSKNVKFINPQFEKKTYNSLKPYIGLLKNAYLILFSQLGYSMFFYKEICDIREILLSTINKNNNKVSALLNKNKRYYFLFDNFVKNPFKVDYEYEGINVIFDDNWLSFFISFKLNKEMYYVLIPIGDFNLENKFISPENVCIDFTIYPLINKMSYNKWNRSDDNILKLHNILKYRIENKLPL